MSTAAQKVSDLPGSLQKIVGAFQMVSRASLLVSLLAGCYSNGEASLDRCRSYPFSMTSRQLQRDCGSVCGHAADHVRVCANELRAVR
jgi:hypothetical protein